jgi:hypothetical protein
MLRRHSPPATADQLTPAVPNRNIDPVTRLASNDEEFHLLPLGSIVRGRWKLVKRIGQGAFGQTFLAEDLLQLSSPPPSSSSSSSSSRSLARVAIKIEFSSALVRAPAKIVVPKKQVLRLEVAILKRLQGI